MSRCAVCGCALAGGVERCAAHRRRSEYGSGADPWRRADDGASYPSQRDDGRADELEARRLGEIVRIVLRRGPSTATEIAAELHLGRSTVVEWCGLAVERGRLRRIRGERIVRYGVAT